MTECDLVVHLGLPRCGDALLRRALARVRPQLRHHGVALLAGADLDRLPHISGWNCGPRARKSDAKAFAQELTSSVVVERRLSAGITGRRPVTVVISSDRLAGSGNVGREDTRTFRPNTERSIAHVLRILRPGHTQVVLYTHRQDRLMELSYLYRISEGATHSLTAQFPRRFEPVLDYVTLIDRLHGIPGVDEVVVRPFEVAQAGVTAYVNDFLGLLGLADTLDLDPVGADLSPYPAVYSGVGAQLALAMSPLMETPKQLHRLDAHLRSHYLLGERYPIDVMHRDVRDQVLATYRERNEELFKSYVPDLPANSYGDDIATFALGNALMQPTPVTSAGLDGVRARVSEFATGATVNLERHRRRVIQRARRQVSRRLEGR